MKTRLLLLCLSGLFFMLTSCRTELPADSSAVQVRFAPEATVPDEFGDYWYQGEAELTSYDLEQVRYGEIREGSAVLIFVTEDFSRSRQVKIDNVRDSNDKLSVMKLNFTRNFETGIYPYSTMTSIFTPISADKAPHTLKVTTSSQEWCGHTFTQLNRKRNAYDLELRSYFESEGDLDESLKTDWLEDEIWTRIRLNPTSLPVGQFTMVPGTLHQRFSHRSYEVVEAQGRIEEVEGEAGMERYVLEYSSGERTLSITYQRAFPFEIEYWEEFEARSGLTTKGMRKERIMLDYWAYNDLEHGEYREQLGLD